MQKQAAADKRAPLGSAGGGRWGLSPDRLVRELNATLKTLNTSSCVRTAASFSGFDSSCFYWFNVPDLTSYPHVHFHVNYVQRPARSSGLQGPIYDK